MKRLLLVLCLLSVGASVEAAVAFDANATADCATNAALTTGLTCATLTVGVGSNRALVCQVVLSHHAPTAEVMIWDFGGTNQAMTQIVAADNAGVAGRAELWGLVAPTSGANTVKYTAVGGTSDIGINCVSWTGVDQTGGTTSFPHATSATANSATPSVTVTSAVGNATMDCVANQDTGFGSPTQTQTFNDASFANISAAGQRAAGAATVTLAWTVTSTWVSVGTDILAAGGGGGCTLSPTLTLLGVGNCKG